MTQDRLAGGPAVTLPEAAAQPSPASVNGTTAIVARRHIQSPGIRIGEPAAHSSAWSVRRRGLTMTITTEEEPVRGDHGAAMTSLATSHLRSVIPTRASNTCQTMRSFDFAVRNALKPTIEPRAA